MAVESRKPSQTNPGESRKIVAALNVPINKKSDGEELDKSVQNVDIMPASRDEYPLIAREDGGRKEMRRRVRALVHR